MNKDEYILEAMANLSEQMGLSLPKESLKELAEEAIAANSVYDEQHRPGGYGCDGNWFDREIKELKSELRREREKRFCIPCQGSGRLEEVFGGLRSIGPCHHCNGNGKY